MPARAIAAVIQQTGEYLICQRPAHKRNGGLWEFARGRLQQDESIPDAVRRKVPQELGVDIRTVGSPLFSVAEPDSDLVVEFVPITIIGEPSCIEYSALRWLRIDELPSLQLGPSDRQFVEFLEASQARKK